MKINHSIQLKDNKLKHFLNIKTLSQHHILDIISKAEDFHNNEKISIKGKIISLGHNSSKTHPFQSLYGKNDEAVYLHAETSAISNSLNHLNKTELDKSTIYVYRVKRPRNNTKV